MSLRDRNFIFILFFFLSINYSGFANNSEECSRIAREMFEQIEALELSEKSSELLNILKEHNISGELVEIDGEKFIQFAPTGEHRFINRYVAGTDLILGKSVDYLELKFIVNLDNPDAPFYGAFMSGSEHTAYIELSQNSLKDFLGNGFRAKRNAYATIGHELGHAIKESRRRVNNEQIRGITFFDLDPSKRVLGDYGDFLSFEEAGTFLDEILADLYLLKTKELHLSPELLPYPKHIKSESDRIKFLSGNLPALSVEHLSDTFAILRGSRTGMSGIYSMFKRDEVLRLNDSRFKEVGMSIKQMSSSSEKYSVILTPHNTSFHINVFVSFRTNVKQFLWEKEYTYLESVPLVYMNFFKKKVVSSVMNNYQQLKNDYQTFLRALKELELLSAAPEYAGLSESIPSEFLENIIQVTESEISLLRE